MSSVSIRQVVRPYRCHLKSSASTFIKPAFITFTSHNNVGFLNLAELRSKHNMVAVCKASSSPLNDDEDQGGVSLGTMKLPSNIDIARFETLLFQVLCTTFNAVSWISLFFSYLLNQW